MWEGELRLKSICWVSLDDEHTIINLGLSGRQMQKNTSLSYWKEAEFNFVTNVPSDIIIIMLGSNDGWEWNGVDVFKNGYKDMVRTF